MGEVHLAKLSGVAGFEKFLIVKTILPSMSADPQFVDRFHHEAKVLVHLTHSNIAQVHDMGQSDGRLYMAIEYVPGVDLARVMDRAREVKTTIPVSLALFVAQQMLEALGYAHRKVGADGKSLGIVHRDISPHNVMVSYEGEVKVIDFGLAKSTGRSKQTLPSTVMGKLGYMSPEQARGEPVDHRSDIYSAGIVIWEMLTGRSMFQSGTIGEMVAAMANPKVGSPRSLRPELSTAVEALVMRALALEPDGRFAKADDFARALNEVAVREGMAIGAEEVGQFVRATCPEEFTAERQLQSRLSSMRRAAEATTPEGELLGNTQIRSSSSSNPRVSSPKAFPLTPAQRALSVAAALPVAPMAAQAEDVLEPPERSKAPFVAVGALLCLVLAGGVLLFSGNDKAAPLHAVAAAPIPQPTPILAPLDASTAPVAVAPLRELPPTVEAKPKLPTRVDAGGTASAHPVAKPIEVAVPKPVAVAPLVPAPVEKPPEPEVVAPPKPVEVAPEANAFTGKLVGKKHGDDDYRLKGYSKKHEWTACRIVLPGGLAYLMGKTETLNSSGIERIGRSDFRKNAKIRPEEIPEADFARVTCKEGHGLVPMVEP